MIHIAEVTAKEIEKVHLKRVALLGTKFTMEDEFFKKKLSKFGVETIIPDENDRGFIHQSIFAEMGKGIFLDETKNRYLNIMKRLISQGAEGIIFGCTEIPILIKPKECDFQRSILP